MHEKPIEISCLNAIKFNTMIIIFMPYTENRKCIAREEPSSGVCR